MNFIPLWLIGGLFFYILSSINLRETADQADIAAQSTTDISSFDSGIPRQNAISLLKQQLFTAKNHQISSKFNPFDDGKQLLPNVFLPFLSAYLGPILPSKRDENTVVKPVIFALQRAPPSTNCCFYYV